MKEFLHIEEESSSMSLTLSRVSDRDFSATEDLLQSFANFIKIYGNYLNRTDDVPPPVEEAFLLEYERVQEAMLHATERIRQLMA